MNPESNNRLLSFLTGAERDQITPYLETVDLPARMKLARSRFPLDHVYFIDSGLVSVVVSTKGHDEAEVGVIGNEGAACCGIFLDAGVSSQDICVQTAGSGQRIRATDMAQVMTESPSIRQKMLHYIQTMSAQQDAAAIAGMRGNIAQRLARWLLMAQDRLGNDIYVTHALLAATLGTRRAGVTFALGGLLKAGAIVQHRAHIQVVDRTKLKETAQHFYGAPEAEYERLFPSTLH